MSWYLDRVVDIGGINDWDTAGLERLSSSLTSRASTLIDLGDQLDQIKLVDGWVGESIEVARRAFDAVVDHLTDSAAQVGAIKRLTGDTEDAVTALKRALAEVSSLAFAHDFAVCNDNTLWDRWAFERPANQTGAEAVDRQRMKAELLDRIGEIVRRGTEIEDKAADIMTAAARNLISDNDSTDVREALGIDASRSDDPHLTAIGHSSGSLTTGFALQNGTGVDDAVFMGSPGVGTDNLGALDITGDAYTLASGGDGVAALAAFDGDPREINGIHDLSTRAADVVMPDGTDVALMSTDRFTGPIVERMGSHSDYYTLDTTSQFNQAAVIAGIPDVAVAR